MTVSTARLRMMAQRLLRSALMPSILRVGPYRFYFYSSDRREPPHVHVERGSYRAKLWLAPVRLGYSGGFRRREVARIISLVWEHHQQLLEAWNEFFSH
jgi:hypothetical protein